MSWATWTVRGIVTVLAGVLAPPAAAAVHWPGFGGGPGRSGAQEVAVGQPPVIPAYALQSASPVRTSVITTGGRLNQQMLAYGTVAATDLGHEGRLVLRNLAKGDAVGGAEGIAFGATDEDAFGTPAPAGGGRGGSVTPVDSSGSAMGQIFVVFNTDDLDAAEPMSPDGSAPSGNDIGIAQIDPSSSSSPVVMSAAVGPPYLGPSGVQPQVADGYTVESAPVLSAPDSEGTRALVFVARGPGGSARLFKVTIEDAGEPGAVVKAASVQVVDVPGANPYASPAIAYLVSPDHGVPVAYVLVPGTGSTAAVRTFRLYNLQPGPMSGQADGEAQTPAVPPDPSGLLSGQDGAQLSRSPAVFVAVDVGGRTSVRRLVQEGGSLVLAEAAETTVGGAPGPALAVSQPYDAAVRRLAPGRVAVPTGENMWLLDSESLEVLDALSDPGESPLRPGGSGFSRTAPVISGDHVYAMGDAGGPAILRLSDGEPICGISGVACDTPEFEDAPDIGADAAIGQPAVSNGFVQFATDAGIAVYRNSPRVRLVAPLAGAVLSRTVGALATVGAGRGVSKVTFTLDGAPVGTVTEADETGTFAGSVNTTTVDDGPHTLGAQAIDADGKVVDEDALAVRIDNIPDPTAAFAHSPVPALTGQVVRFDAADSHTNPEGGGLSYEWDLDGDGGYETDGGYKPRITKVFDAAGTYTVGLFVTDGNGQTAATTRQLVVTDPPPPVPNKLPVAAFATSANPVAPGSTVVFDATGSSDFEGPLQRFQWDLDGNGSFETDTGTVASATRRYDDGGLYKVTLRVVDAAGATATQTTVLSVMRFDERRKPIVSARGALTRAGRVSARGRVQLAGGAPMLVPCEGVVQATVKIAGRRAGRRRANVSAGCRFSLRLKVRLRRRARERVVLELRYLGSEALFPRAAAPLRLRVSRR